MAKPLKLRDFLKRLKDLDPLIEVYTNDDLALLLLAAPLPTGMGFPTLESGAGIGDLITLVGFGRSGYGSYGYTSNASLTDRRFGSNVIDGFKADF